MGIPYGIISTEKPNDLVIAVVGLKVINVGFDIAFYVKQRNITKIHNSSISKANCAESIALFADIAFLSIHGI